MARARDRVLLVDSIDPGAADRLRARADVVLCAEASFDGIRNDARDADAVITRSRLPDDLFEAAPRLRAAMIHGTGMDLVPLASATAHGVAVSRIPGGNAQSVAEYCVMSMLVLARNLPEIHSSIRTKPWDDTRKLGAKAHEIAGMTVGVVGVGEIGRRVAKICRQGFGMRVLGHQRRLDAVGPDAEPAPLERLVAESDFVVLTCPLTPETHHLFNATRLSSMKPTAWLVNVGRGAVVDEAALVAALREQRIGGAMLDVYEHYRLPPGHPLFSLPNAVLTPHLAGMTQESRVRMGATAAEETLRMLAGEPPRNFVNPDVLPKFLERSRAKA